MNSIPYVTIVGKSGTGKTTVLEKLVPELVQRGLRVAVVKHHAHTTPIDNSGKDSARFAQAGADLVVVASPVEMARFERTDHELKLAEIVERITNVDLILTEGFKREPAPKIEVSRAETSETLLASPEELIAVVTDHALNLNIPTFDLDDAAGVAEFIIRHFALAPQGQ